MDDQNIGNLGQGQQQANQMQQRQMIQNAKTFECKCGGKMFEEKLMFKRISPLMTKSGQEEYAPMRLIVCTSCGLVPREFDSDNVIPDDLKTSKLDSSTNE